MIKLEVLCKDVALFEQIFPADAKTFPDGTPAIVFEFDTYNLDMAPSEWRILWIYENMAELFVLQCIADKIRSTEYKNLKITLDLPYVPNARMDRVKNTHDVFTLKTFSNIINSMEFDKVRVYNIHSNVSLALINNVEHIDCEKEIYEIIDICKPDTLYYPDEGAMKRYSEMKVSKEHPFVFGMKKRDWVTGNILGLDIIGDTDLVKDKTILIVDDICSKGGTFKFSALKLKELGAKEVYLFITHCENVIDIDALKESGISRVFTTNTIFSLDDPFVKVLKKF
ncbi:MAG: hypothetical protein MJZ00_03950 [Paludibacteraceae bacterium]|nr:hypothetical protein [Paludibacteraceae bacterium]